MPSKTDKQVNTAKLAGDVKAGKFPKSKSGPSVISMSKMPMNKLKHFMKIKECMTEEQKKRLLKVLKSIKEEYTGNIGGETDIKQADNLQVNEDEYTSQMNPERNVVAKTFDTEADFDSYINQRRGIQMTPKEIQAVMGYKKAKPTQQDKFFIKYETTDDFGNNDTTVIKKLKEGNQFCWTAFSKHETAEEEGKPEGEDKNSGEKIGGGEKDKGGELPDLKDLKNLKEVAPTPATPSNVPSAEPDEDDQDITVNDPIRITKTITFADETEGANILADFLTKLDL